MRATASEGHPNSSGPHPAATGRRTADDVPCHLIDTADGLAALERALRSAQRVAIDTEVPIDGPRKGRLRAMSAATRAGDGVEESFVVDARDVAPEALAELLHGVEADAWNADFDARVLDEAIWATPDTTPHLRWWDAQLGDALLHQGRSGFTWYHSLAWATEHYLGLETEGKGTIQTSFTAGDDLSPDQVRYAAADAVHTLWVGDEIRSALTIAELDDIAAIEMAARPFLDQMQRTGLPFDWDGWRAELNRIEGHQREAIDRLATLTGGGQGNLFDQVTEPTWNPGSDRQVKDALNRYATDRVLTWTERRHGRARPLDETDSVSASVLREIGGPLSDAVLDYRNCFKILTTYGDSIGEHLHPDGRLHPQYLQVVGTNTGRLASRNPNAQNLAPRMLPFIRPPEADRVFVHADLSQAELRVLAQVGDDEALRQAFARGDDVHVATAASMFGFDPVDLRTTDPERYAHLRKVAKALNFGIAYGSGAAALSRTLTAEGTPTTVDQATELLTRYRATYPGTAAWAEDRIAEIRSVADRVDDIDWRLTVRLARGHGSVTSIRREFRRAHDRWPTIAEITALHPDQHTSDGDELAERITWLASYPAPVALTAEGEPFTFACRTVGGRRQQFNLHLDRLFLVAVTEAVRSTDRALVAVRDRFGTTHGLDLGAGDDLSAGRVERAFEHRPLRLAYLEAVARAIGTSATDAVLARAAKERANAMVNAWRNAPIQGTVADIMLVAYARLNWRLRRYPDARPVQTVHDSIVIECPAADATAVAAEARSAMEAASRRFCPDVVPRADVDIRRSLADGDELSDDEVATLA
jgi:DNA polymerase I-like protein with 3'-5' exonuclease and polymerase domains